MATLPPVGAGKVVGRFISFDADGADVDLLPDANPLVGTVTFTPSPNSVKVPNATPPATAYPSAITVNLDANGYLSQASGVQGVWLIPTDDPSLNPSGFTYQVTANLRTAAFRIVAFTAFSISVPTWNAAANGGLGNAVDLTSVAPVSSSNGTPMVQGPVGPAPTLTNRNVTTTTDPNAAGFTLVPTGVAGAYWVDYVQLVGTGGGGGSGSVSKVAGVSPDGAGNVPLTPANIGAPTIADVTTAQNTASSALGNANTAQAAANAAQTTANTAITGLGNKVDTSTLTANYAPLVSPNLTGAPKAPTPATSDNSTTIATTAFVKTVAAASAAAGTYGTAAVGWNVTTASWSSARPAVTGPVLWISTNSSTATRPADMAIGDAWMQNPDSATA